MGKPRRPKGWRPGNKTAVTDYDGQRLRIAKYLAGRGPVWGDAAAAELGLTLEQWWKAVEKCRWFSFDAPGPAGWTLTPEGVSAVSDAGRVRELEGRSV